MRLQTTVLQVPSTARRECHAPLLELQAVMSPLISVLGTQSGPVEEKYVLLTVEPSLYSWLVFSKVWSHKTSGCKDITGMNVKLVQIFAASVTFVFCFFCKITFYSNFASLQSQRTENFNIKTEHRYCVRTIHPSKTIAAWIGEGLPRSHPQLRSYG